MVMTGRVMCNIGFFVLIGISSILVGCESSGYKLNFELKRDSVVAGDSVPYSAMLIGDSETVEVTVAVVSDLEPGLVSGPATITPTVAGEHTLMAQVQHGGVMYTAQISLEVTPGQPDSVDLILADEAIVAGESTTFSVRVFDRFGNTIEPLPPLELGSDEPDLRIRGSSVTCTRSGEHTITVTTDGASDSEVLRVLPTQAVSISVALGNPNVEQGYSTLVFADMRDMYGNPADDPWTLSAEGTGMVAVEGKSLTFYDEGIYTVTGTVDGTSVSDTLGPIVFDWSGPIIDIDVPARASWATESVQSVRGEVRDTWSAIQSVTLQSVPFALSPDGSFDEVTPCERGICLITTEAIDTDGNCTDDQRSVLVGEFGGYGEFGVGDGVTRGIEVRLYRGAGGLQILADRLAAVVDVSILDDYISNPVASEQTTQCTLGLCVEFAVTLSVDNPAMSHATVALEPQSTGGMRTHLRVYNPSFDWHGVGTISSVVWSGSGDVYASYVDVWATFYPAIVDHEIRITAASVSVVTYGFVFDMTWWLEDILEFFGLYWDVQDYIRLRMEAAIVNAVRVSLPAVLEQALQEYEIDETFSVQGVPMNVQALPSRISVDSNGVTLGLETYMTADTWALPADYDYLGSLRADYVPPSWYAGSGATLGLSTDFLNQALLALWGGGLLNVEVTDEDLGISLRELNDLFPDLTDLTVTIEPRLPPVVVPGSGDEVLTLQLGDYLLSIYDGASEPGNLVMQTYATAFVDMTFSVSPEMTLLPVLEGVASHFDIVLPTGGSEQQEALMSLIFPLLLPTLSEQLEGIPLPSIEGVSLDVSQVYGAGADGGFVAVSGALVSRP